MSRCVECALLASVELKELVCQVMPSRQVYTLHNVPDMREGSHPVVHR